MDTHTEDISEPKVDAATLAADYDCSPQFFYKAAKDKGLKHYRVGRLYRFKPSEVEQWCQRKIEPGPQLPHDLGIEWSIDFGEGLNAIAAGR